MTELDDLLTEFESSMPATPDQLASVEATLRIAIPSDLAEFLLTSGSGEGFVQDAYLRIWPVDEWPEHNASLSFFSEWADLVLIGSSGGNDVYGINRLTFDYVVAEMIGDQDPVLLGHTFLEFVRAVAEGGRS